MNTGKILTGALIGVAVGAALGILFAPDKGSVTRKKLTKSGEDLMDDVKSQIDQISESAKQKYANMKNGVEDTVNTAKSKASEVKNDVKKSMS